MFGMNAKDAMGLAEDMAVLRGSVPRPQVTDSPRSSSSGEAAVMVAAVGMKALQVQRDENQKLVQKWNSLATDFSDLKAVVVASRAVIEKQIAELAKATGADPEVVRKATYAALSQAYNDQVGNMLSIGELQNDPRKDVRNPKWKNREWFSPSASM